MSADTNSDPGDLPAVSRRLRGLLVVTSTIVVLLGANSIYLAGVRLLEWQSRLRGHEIFLQNYFHLWMVLVHLALGLLVIVPFVAFSSLHMLAARCRPNRKAVRLGYAVVLVSIILLVSGVLLLRAGILELKHPATHAVVYWIHVAAPLVAACLYALHRMSGPRIHWRSGAVYGLVAAASLGVMTCLHSSHPDQWRADGPDANESSFHPSLARTSSGEFIPAGSLMMDAYCMKCHPDVFDGWLHSAHHFSSFNNPMYLASVRETRSVVLRRDGNVSASRWCAGCHDPVPLFSGAFDDPNFDDVRHPTAHAGITCTVCHMITEVNSPRGNADYTIDAPVHYPLTGSKNPVLRYINEQLVKAKPSFHKRMFLRPLHRTSEFCSTCHKVHLPRELNHYRDFVRGQNHYDSFLLSGMSGHGVRSSYFPMQASENCGHCHMPMMESDDFGARPLAQSGALAVHDHLFVGANTALPWLHKADAVTRRHQDFLRNAVRIDIIALRENGRIDGQVTVPLRENLWLKDPHRREHKSAVEAMKHDRSLPVLKPGSRYLLDVVIRNLKTGHHFTQGTADSNQVWLDVVVRSGGRVIGRSGGIDDDNRVDPWAHFVNAWVIDRDGNRIDRRNPQDIFTVLYDHQIGPGSAQVVHYELEIPNDLSDLITVDANLRYRKFDSRYMEFVAKSARPGDPPIRGAVPSQRYRNELPITVLASDRIIFPVDGIDKQAPHQEYPITVDHVYQRWHDYGIALMKEGAGNIPTEEAGAELRLAEEMFLEVDRRFGYPDPRLHLAQLYLMEGRIDEAATAINRTKTFAKPLFFTEPVFPPWAIAWLSGLINRQQGNLDAAIHNFQSVLNYSDEQVRHHGFDFSRDYIVINELGQTLIERSKLERGTERKAARDSLLTQASEQFAKTLRLDPENVMAHHNLAIIHELLGDHAAAAEHRRLHDRYKPDDNAHDRARQLARKLDPAANHAAERIVIYPLNRPGAPGSTDNRQTQPHSRSATKSGAVK